LLVKNVDSSDYGRYDCVAQNEVGLTRHFVNLNVTSAPDPPSSLDAVKVTATSVTLKWTPGFDGGYVQSFRIRYRKEEEQNSRYVDVADNATIVNEDGEATFEVLDLKSDTGYRFAVMASNAVGRSNYTKDILGIRTSGKKAQNLRN